MNLYVSGSSSTYSLSGSGLLSTTSEQIQGAISLFQQSGGTNAVAYLNLSGGRYLLSHGLLQVNGGLATAGGTLDGGGGSATIQANNSIVHLTGSIVNTASTSLVVSPNSLAIASTSSTADFGVFQNGGLVHVWVNLDRVGRNGIRRMGHDRGSRQLSGEYHCYARWRHQSVWRA